MPRKPRASLPTPVDIPIPGEPPGAFVLYPRKLKKGLVYYARRRLPMQARANRRNPYHVVSLETADLDQARIAAYRLLVQIDGKVTAGQSLREHSFEKVAHDWLNELEADSQTLDESGRPLVEKSAVKRYRTILKRYLIPFFGTQSVAAITHDLCREYLRWRQRFYLDGPGKQEELIHFKRNGKELSRPAKKTVRPAFSTMHKDAVVFNQVLRHAVERMKLIIPNLPKIRFEKTDVDQDTRRPRFLPDEMKRLVRELRLRAQRKAGQSYEVYYYRRLLYFLVYFLLHTGLRPNEVMWLQRKHLSGSGFGARVQVARDNPGLKQLTHARSVVPTKGLWAAIVEMFKFYSDEGVPWPGGKKPVRDDLDPDLEYWDFSENFWLWSHPDGSRIASMDHGFSKALDDLGLAMTNGRRRSLYSIRHTYASEQIEMGATRNGVAMLCANLGTSEAMLRKHYGQALHELAASELQIGKGPRFGILS